MTRQSLHDRAGTFASALYLVGRVVRVMNNNKLSLLMLHIWLVRLFMLRKVEFTNAPYLVGRVVRVTENEFGLAHDG